MRLNKWYNKMYVYVNKEVTGVQVLKINMDTLKIMGKFTLLMLGILLIVFLVAVATPYIARKIEGARNNPARVKNDPYKFEKDNVKSIYDINNNENKEDENNGRK